MIQIPSNTKLLDYLLSMKNVASHQKFLKTIKFYCIFRCNCCPQQTKHFQGKEKKNEQFFLLDQICAIWEYVQFGRKIKIDRLKMFQVRNDWYWTEGEKWNGFSRIAHHILCSHRCSIQSNKQTDRQYRNGLNCIKLHMQFVTVLVGCMSVSTWNIHIKSLKMFCKCVGRKTNGEW